MAKLVDIINEAVEPLLQSDEELRSVGHLESGIISLPSWSLMLLAPILIFFKSYWFAGISNMHLFLIRRNVWGKTDVKHKYSIPFRDIELDGEKIIAILSTSACIR